MLKYKIHFLLLIFFIFTGILSAQDGSTNPMVKLWEDLQNNFGVKTEILIAQILHFLIVAFLLYKFAIKPILKTHDERQKKIADGLQYAEEMKVQLLEAQKERQEKIKQAVDEAKEILNDARDQSKSFLEKKVHEASSQAESLIKKASEATELERQKMLEEVKHEVARLVVSTTSKVLSKELSDSEKERYAKSAADSLSQNNLND